MPILSQSRRALQCLILALAGSGFAVLATEARAQPAQSERSNPAGRVTNPAPESMSPEIRRAYEMNLQGFGAGIGPRVPLFNSPEVYEAGRLEKPLAVGVGT
jgi:hypothetical protein